MCLISQPVDFKDHPTGSLVSSIKSPPTKKGPLQIGSLKVGVWKQVNNFPKLRGKRLDVHFVVNFVVANLWGTSLLGLGETLRVCLVYVYVWLCLSPYPKQPQTQTAQGKNPNNMPKHESHPRKKHPDFKSCSVPFFGRHSWQGFQHLSSLMVDLAPKVGDDDEFKFRGPWRQTNGTNMRKHCFFQIKWNIIPCWCNWTFVETFLGFDFVVFFFEKTCELVLSVSMSSSNFYKCCPTLIFLQIFVVLLLPSSFWSLIPGVSTEVLFATLQHTFFEVKFPCYGKKYCLNSGKPRALDNFLPCFLDSCWMTAALGHLR